MQRVLFDVAKILIPETFLFEIPHLPPQRVYSSVLHNHDILQKREKGVRQLATHNDFSW